MTRAQIAATIAYTLDQFGFTPIERARVASAFASDLRLTGNRRTRFLNDCRKASEQEARDAQNIKDLTR